MAKRYEKYKDSGIAWIGEIPEHWEVCRFKFITSKIGDGLHGTPLYDEEGDYYFVNGNNLGSKRIELKDSTKKLNYSEFVKYKKDIAENSLLISLNGTIGSVSLYNNEPIVLSKSAGYLVLKTNQQRNFIYHVSNSVITNTFWMLSISGTTIANLSLEALRNTYVVSVPFREQEQIAKYLDWKCGEVDRIVEVRERQIKLLGELRTSVISRAVTRGLDPNAPLKDSGIDWIGQIPEHWEVRKVSRIFSRIGSGTTPKSGNEDYYAENGENWLQTGDLNDSYIYETSKKITKKALDEHSLRFYPEGSIVMAMYGATIGKLGLLNISTTTNQACCVMSGNTVCHSKYSFNTLLAARTHILTLAYGGGQPNISQDTIKTIKLPIPPIEEQQQIADYLDKKTAEIDSAIEKFKAQIDKIKEYRQALITEVVTGKIDVRGIDIPTPKSN